MTDFINFMQSAVSAFHVTQAQERRLGAAGFKKLSETDSWQLEPGCGYYVTRNGSSLIAFRIPENEDFSGFVIEASHSDAPALKLKFDPEMLTDGIYNRLNIETYGGGVWHTWIDRPLSAAGRITVRTDSGFRTVCVNVDRDLLLIPGLAIHMDKDINSNLSINAQNDLLPLFSLGEGRIADTVAQSAGVKTGDIVSAELFLYPRIAPFVWGQNGEFISAPHLDDAACVYCSLEGFLAADRPAAIPVHAVLDNEEVGSSTKQGAASTFLRDVLERISCALSDEDNALQRRLAKSFMLSSDNAHAFHPNYPSKCDPKLHPHLGGGVVIKHSANQKYTTDAESEAITLCLCEKGNVKYQHFHNRSDIPGGSTLGNVSGNQAALRAADIGLPQLAMHSACETMACSDVEELIKLSKALFSSGLSVEDNNITIS